MEERVPVGVGLGMGLLFVVVGAVVAVVSRRAADGRLGPNGYAGIRTSATLRSEAAWRSGHAAGRGLSDASGGLFALCGLGSVLVRPAPVWAAVLLVGATVATGLLLLAARRAGRAARAAG